MLLCCKWIFYVRTLGGFTSWAPLFRNNHKLDVAGVEYSVELGLHLRKTFPSHLTFVHLFYCTKIWHLHDPAEGGLELYDGHADGVAIASKATWYVVLFHLTPTPKSVTCNVQLKARRHMYTHVPSRPLCLFDTHNSLNCRFKAGVRGRLSVYWWLGHWLCNHVWNQSSDM